MALKSQTYTDWRSTTLGRLTEEVEVRAVFQLAGNIAGKRVLDVGTGDGTYAIEAAKRGAKVTALDIEQDMLDAAGKRASEAKMDIELKEGSITALPFREASFDIVIGVTVLCFLPDPEHALREIARVLAPEGQLILGDLNRFSLWAAGRRLRSWFSHNIWRQVSFRSEDTLKELMVYSGFCIMDSQRAVYFPPIGLIARLMASADAVMAYLHFPGAAFIAIKAQKPEDIHGQS